jgi:hypothetical protein
VVSLDEKGKSLADRCRQITPMALAAGRNHGSNAAFGLCAISGSKAMQQQSTSSQKPLTGQAVDSQVHLVAEIKDKDTRPKLRIRPIVPNIFRTPN